MNSRLDTSQSRLSKRRQYFPETNTIRPVQNITDPLQVHNNFLQYCTFQVTSEGRNM
jgi:hypothetical protein